MHSPRQLRRRYLGLNGGVACQIQTRWLLGMLPGMLATSAEARARGLHRKAAINSGFIGRGRRPTRSSATLKPSAAADASGGRAQFVGAANPAPRAWRNLPPPPRHHRRRFPVIARPMPGSLSVRSLQQQHLHTEVACAPLLLNQQVCLGHTPQPGGAGIQHATAATPLAGDHAGLPWVDCTACQR